MRRRLGLDFACLSLHRRRCRRRCAARDALDLDDVLDLGEAAESIDWTETDLAGAAEAGRVKHRPTPRGGILLFMRRDLLALTGRDSMTEQKKRRRPSVGASGGSARPRAPPWRRTTPHRGTGGSPVCARLELADASRSTSR